MRLRGMSGRAHARRAIAAFVCATIAFAASDIALVRIVSASQDDTQAANYDVYSGQVYATADREQVGTTVDANFGAGAIDNFYPLAYSNVATAGTNALATWADTGPFVQAVLGGGLNGEVLAQPQYVHAQYPGTENPGAFTSPTGASASASVTPASARANSYATSAENPPGTPSDAAASRDALATALAAWHQTFLGSSPASAGTAGSAAASAPPDGADGDTGVDTVYFDSTNGFVTTGTSRVAHASFGGGEIVLDNVRVDVSVSNPGDGSQPKTSVSIQVGAASVGGVPVSIGQNGVTVASQSIPADQVQQASQALNQALASSGFSVHLVTPIQTTQGASEHVDAVGVQVGWVQPAALTPSGVPSQFVTHTLGEVVVDNEATLAAPSASSLLGGAFTPLGDGAGFAGLTGGGATSTSTTLPAGSSAPAATAPPRHQSTPTAVRIATAKPTWLLLLYLAWQALLIGTAASIYLWRSGSRIAALTP